MTDAPSSQDIEQILNNVLVAEATSRAALKEIWDTRSRLRRVEASLALILGSLVEFQDETADYVVHRLSQELRRLAETPDTAAKLAGCPDDDVDPSLLQAIASHLSGMRSESAWQAPSPAPVVMH
jgi:hypothetical protein